MQGNSHGYFLDDGLGGGVSILNAKINSLIVHADLTRYGFLINEDKSLWEPVQNITWLGTVFDTDRGFISVTDFEVKSSTVEPRLSGPRLSGLFDYPDFFSGPVFFMNINKL